MVHTFFPARIAFMALLALACAGWVGSEGRLIGAAELPGLSIYDVARVRAVDELALSPAGTHAAYVLTVPRRAGVDEDGPAWAELHVVDDGGESRPFVTGEVNVEKVSWLPDGSAISFVAKRDDDEHKSLYEIPIGGGEARKVLEHGDGIVEYAWSPDGARLAFLAKPAESEVEEKLEEKGFKQEVFEEEWRPVEVWLASRREAELGEPRRIDLAGSASELSWSPTGERLAVALAPTSLIDDRYMKRRVWIVDPEGTAAPVSIETTGKLEKVAWSPDGARLALIAGASANDPAAARLMLAEAGTGAVREIAPGLEGDAVDVAWRDESTLLWVAARGVETSLERFALAGASDQLLATGGPIWRRLAVSAGGDRIALIGQTPSHPDEVFFLDPGSASPRRLTDSNSWLAERTLAPQEVVTFAARDGLELEGLLLRPIEAPEGEPVPLVLVVHGGPESHFSNGWLTTYSRPGQVLAARGYAVFYPNYRGSTGRGLEFASTSQADPAGKEFEDLIDAVDHLVEIGLVDRDRVGVTGGSYGGYATAWCSTYFSERFAAGVMFVGISEKISKVGTSDIPNELYLVHARRWPWENWELMLERSPVRYVEKAKTPLLIMGGDADTRVHPSQSLVLYRYLKILGQAPVRYVVYPGEEHGNRKAAARLDFGLRLLRWFDHYLVGPGGEPPPPELDYGPEVAAALANGAAGSAGQAQLE